MKKILFAGLGALTALFCCCNKPAPTPPEPTLELSTTQVNCPATLYSQMVEVTTNVSDWSATFKQTAPTGWSLAKKGSQLTISVSANTELKPITATVVVKASEGISKEITVNQLGQAPAILLSQKTAILDNGYPRELAVEITTNIEPQVKIEGNWLTLKEPKASKAMVAKSYRFAVAQNGQEPRTGKIIFVKAGGETPSDTMLVFQPAFADTLLLYKATEMNISYGVGGKSFNSKQTDLLSKMEQGTIIVQQLSSIADKQTLVGLADDRQGTAYFTLYIDGKNIGFETHGVTHIRGEAATTRPVAKLQTIALKATKGQGYKLFANGRLLLSLPLTGSNYQFLSNIEGLNSAAVGKLPRASGNDIFPYSGQMKMVEIYDSLLSDERLLEITNQTPAPKEFAPVARFDMFYKGDATRCNQFRIPSLLSLSDGTVLASMDARFGGTFDSPNNLDNALRRSTDGGHSFGEATLPLNFTDFPNTSGYRTWSASFIDPVMMEDKINRRVYMMVDAFPWGGGIATAGRCLPGSGFKTIGTEKYLALTSDPVPEDKQTADQDMANFNFTIRQGGIIWDDRSNQPTEYSVNNHFELLHKGIPLTVKQQLYESVDAPMSIYFERSLFRVFRTSYLWIIHSDDS
ncbi:MAG: sialidase domain-containing protein, partial [Mucinivorans sp.]